MELSESQLLIAKRLDFVVMGGIIHPMPRKNIREIARQLYALAETDEDAKQLVLTLQWNELDRLQASARGWILTSEGAIVLSAMNVRYSINEQAADHVKQLAQDGDILAQKALIESARRQLNGYSKNDKRFTARYRR